MFKGCKMLMTLVDDVRRGVVSTKDNELMSHHHTIRIWWGGSVDITITSSSSSSCVIGSRILFQKLWNHRKVKVIKHHFEHVTHHYKMTSSMFNLVLLVTKSRYVEEVYHHTFFKSCWIKLLQILIYSDVFWNVWLYLEVSWGLS